ncbi:UNVERIFIED_CONTAM: AP3-complex subunit beta-A [Sesamum angustifolium]|uniref:AP3-complex subunit beta-A n=1 Tax=Sesamum angustifolium TaxID=2727405 RepID=A0AAW2P069_9LAMI
MLTQFGATADSLSKASTMMFRIGTDAHLYDDPDDVSIAPLLDSKFDSEKCEALKRLLALIAQGFDVSSYFPQVVKNVASQSVEVKKLVYLYLLHYAEKYGTGQRPNETLLSINCFQKDLGDPNPLVRAWALRTMAGIRLHVIAPLVLVAVGKCARDPSIYVRKCAAIALPKLHDLRLEEHTAAIEELVGMLLKDNSPGVVGAAAAAFASICPTNFSVIGRNYKRLCETLPDVEEWGQIVLIGILLRYVIAKHGLVRESLMLTADPLVKHNSEGEDLEPDLAMRKPLHETSFDICTEIADILSRSYLEGPDKHLSQLGLVNRDSLGLDSSRVTSAKSNDDVKILLQCTSPLLWSYNSAVVLAAAGVHWIMAPKEDVLKIVKPLLFLLRVI